MKRAFLLLMLVLGVLSVARAGNLPQMCGKGLTDPAGCFQMPFSSLKTYPSPCPTGYCIRSINDGGEEVGDDTFGCAPCAGAAASPTPFPTEPPGQVLYVGADGAPTCSADFTTDGVGNVVIGQTLTLAALAGNATSVLLVDISDTGLVTVAPDFAFSFVNGQLAVSPGDGHDGGASVTVTSRGVGNEAAIGVTSGVDADAHVILGPTRGIGQCLVTGYAYNNGQGLGVYGKTAGNKCNGGPNVNSGCYVDSECPSAVCSPGISGPSDAGIEALSLEGYGTDRGGTERQVGDIDIMTAASPQPSASYVPGKIQFKVTSDAGVKQTLLELIHSLVRFPIFGQCGAPQTDSDGSLICPATPSATTTPTLTPTTTTTPTPTATPTPTPSPTTTNVTLVCPTGSDGTGGVYTIIDNDVIVAVGCKPTGTPSATPTATTTATTTQTATITQTPTPSPTTTDTTYTCPTGADGKGGVYQIVDNDVLVSVGCKPTSTPSATPTATTTATVTQTATITQTPTPSPTTTNVTFTCPTGNGEGGAYQIVDNDVVVSFGCKVTATPSTTPTATPTATITILPTLTAPTRTATPSPTPTKTVTPTPVVTSTAAGTTTLTPTATPTVTATPSPNAAVIHYTSTAAIPADGQTYYFMHGAASTTRTDVAANPGTYVSGGAGVLYNQIASGIYIRTCGLACTASTAPGIGSGWDIALMSGASTLGMGFSLYNTGTLGSDGSCVTSIGQFALVSVRVTPVNAPLATNLQCSWQEKAALVLP